jgi:hypothetical protein
LILTLNKKGMASKEFPTTVTPHWNFLINKPAEAALAHFFLNSLKSAAELIKWRGKCAR